MTALPESFANLLRLCLDVPDRIVQQDEVLPVTGQFLFESAQLSRQGFQLRELLLKAPHVGVQTPELLEIVAERLSLADQAESLRSVQRRPGAGNKLPPETFNARLVELEIAAESLLRPGQLEVLKTYKACLIPPKNLKDPVRVGQAAGSSTQMAKWLDRASRSYGSALPCRGGS